MKHNVIPLNNENKPLAFVELMFGNFLLETTLGCYPTRPTPTPLDTHLWLLPSLTNGYETCILHFTTTSSSSSSSNSSSSSTSTTNGQCTNNLWTMYFDIDTGWLKSWMCLDWPMQHESYGFKLLGVQVHEQHCWVWSTHVGLAEIHQPQCGHAQSGRRFRDSGTIGT